MKKFFGSCILIVLIIGLAINASAIKNIIGTNIQGPGPNQGYCLSLISQTTSVGPPGPIRYISTSNTIWLGITGGSGTPVRVFNEAGTQVATALYGPPNDPQEFVLDTLRGTVWAANFSTSMREFNATTFAATGRTLALAAPAGNASGMSYDVAGDLYYISDQFNDTVRVYVGATLAAAGTITFATTDPALIRYSTTNSAHYVPFQISAGPGARIPTGGLAQNQLYTMDTGDFPVSVAFIGSNIYFTSNVGAGLYGFQNGGTRLFRLTNVGGGTQFGFDSIPSINALVVPGGAGGAGTGLKIYNGTSGTSVGGLCSNASTSGVFNDIYWGATYDSNNGRIYASNRTDSTIDVFDVVPQ